MKLRLPLLLWSALASLWMLPAQTFASESAGKVLHLYLLTGQSNSLGSVKGDPASAELLAQYSSDVQFWNGSIASGRPADPAVQWTTVAPHLPAYSSLPGYKENPCMGPEYGFSYMMQHKGWQVSGTDEVRVIKVSRDGGGNTFWVKDARNSVYGFILSSVQSAINALDDSGYDRIDISGLMYLQGESNNGEETDDAQQRFLNLVSNLKADLATQGYDSSKVTVSLDQSVLGQPASWGSSEKSAVGSDGRSTQQVLRELADNRENIGWVTTRDLDKINPDDTMKVHYNGKAQITIGARYAYAMAMQQGIDVTEGGTLAVRSGEFENGVSLNESASWWGWEKEGHSISELASAVASWDVSSANVGDVLTGSLALGGILVDDPYRSTVSISKAADVSEATLSLGSRGVELRGGNLSLHVDVSTAASQSWKVAAGHSLSLGSASAGVGFSGAGEVTLSRGGEGTATVSLYASSLTAHNWMVGDGVHFRMGGSADFSTQSVAVAAGAGVSLDASGVQLGSLSLGNGSSLDVGGMGRASSLSVDTISLGEGVTLRLDILSASSFDSLSASSWAADSTATTVNFDINYAASLRGNRSYTVFTGWNSDVNFTYNAYLNDEGKALSSLQVVDGNLVLTLGNISGAVSYDVAFPTESQTTTAGISSTGVYDASLSGNNTLTNRNNLSSGAVNFFACQQDGYSGDVYAEAQGVTATTFLGFGSNSGSFTYTMEGNVYLKVSGEGVSQGFSSSKVWGVCNGNLHGNLYIELANPDVTYGEVFGSYNGGVSGSSTLVIRDGTVSGFVVAGVAGAGKTVTEGTYVQIEGGQFRGGVFAGGGATGSVVQNGAHLLINGGSFTSGVVTAGNLSNGAKVDGGASLTINGGTFAGATVSGAGGGTVNGGVKLCITGGDFTDCLGIYAGSVRVNEEGTCSVSGGTEVILLGIDDANDFSRYTGVVSGASLLDGDTVSGTKKLVLDEYLATQVSHALQDFNVVEVRGNSATSLSQEKSLGGATSLALSGESTLNLHVTDAEQGWDTGAAVSVEVGSVLSKDGEGLLSLASLSGGGTVQIGEGKAALGSLSGYEGTLRVESGSTASVEASGGVLATLSGEGRVELEGTQSTTAFQFAEDWRGTVRLAERQQADASGHITYSLHHFGQAGSTIELDGTGLGYGSTYVLLEGSEVQANLHLVGTEANHNTGLYLTAGSSKKTYKFSGSWSGQGDFYFTPASSNVTSTFQFLGDMMSYGGDYIINSGATLLFGNGGTGSAVGSISGTGDIRGTGKEAEYTTKLIYHYSGEVTAENRISANVSLTHRGSGFLNITGQNDYTGKTSIEVGRLLLQGQGTLGSGEVTIKAASRGLQMGEGALILASGADATVSNHALLSASALCGTQEQAARLNHAQMTVQGEILASHVLLENSSVSVEARPDAVLQAQEMRLGASASLTLGENAVVMTAREGQTGTVSGRVTAAGLEGEASGESARLSGVSVEVRDSFSVSHAVLENSVLDVALDKTLSLTSVQVMSSVRITDAPATVALRDVAVRLDTTNTTMTQMLLAGEKTLYQTGDLGVSMTLGAVNGEVEYTAITSATFDSVTLTGSDLLLDFSGLEDELSPGLVCFSFNGGQGEALFDGQALAIRALYGGCVYAGYVEQSSGESRSVWFLIPEPTTVTLSLLGLAALAGRRRRK